MVKTRAVVLAVLVGGCGGVPPGAGPGAQLVGTHQVAARWGRTCAEATAAAPSWNTELTVRRLDGDRVEVSWDTGASRSDGDAGATAGTLNACRVNVLAEAPDMAGRGGAAAGLPSGAAQECDAPTTPAPSLARVTGVAVRRVGAAVSAEVSLVVPGNFAAGRLDEPSCLVFGAR